MFGFVPAGWGRARPHPLPERSPLTSTRPRRALIAVLAFATLSTAGCVYLESKERELVFRPVREYSRSPADAEVEVQALAFLQEYVPAKASPMCGNSICQDRRFLARWMPQLEDWFHYRNLDVSTLKELCRRWKPELMKGIPKEGKHEALADVYESIAELLYYREHFLRS